MSVNDAIHIEETGPYRVGQAKHHRVSSLRAPVG